ncbi:Histone H2A [Astathelohania contejeani]|uniref:Histone H2A n=1 Tax=Astathelohania contejeani TaxID=164912 RepID=A0ABQ7HZM4_9MICR|nr:Histone H2A [Thelohania contejeani]
MAQGKADIISRATQTSGKGKRDIGTLTRKGYDANNAPVFIKMNHARKIIRNSTGMRVSSQATLALVVGTYYCIHEILDAAKLRVDTEGKKKLLPKHINQAIFNDIELSHLGADWVIKNGGVRKVSNLSSIKKEKQSQDL